MKIHERAANLALAGLSLAPLVINVNPNLNVILTACLTVYVGCYRSVKATPPSETMSKEHAMRFPLVGSAMLLSLFLLFKFLSKDLVNTVLTAYFFILGIAALCATLLPSVKRFLPGGWNDNEIVWRAPFFHCGDPNATTSEAKEFVENAVAKPRGGSGWLATDGSKRWGEAFFLLYTPFWLTLCLGVVVPFKLYERFMEIEYLVLGLVSTMPTFVIPLFLVGKADRVRSLKDRYWVKANVWIIIFSYVGNYFWTHYFFTVLGASYTFPSWRMNNVPHTTFLLTHVCFLFYHMVSNMTLRRLRHSTAHLPQSIRLLFDATWVLALSYFIAYLETLAIANFPYYEFVDRDIMYKVGSLFYAIYFLVSFPMFSRIDEKAEKWDLPRVAIDALGAAMLVTIILDLWRLFLGPIVPIPESRRCGQPGLAWFQVQNESV